MEKIKYILNNYMYKINVKAKVSVKRPTPPVSG